MIKTIRIAYKVGFSVALKESTFSAYIEMRNWGLIGADGKTKRLKEAFARGFKAGFKAKSEASLFLKLQKLVYPDISKYFPSIPGEVVNTGPH